MLGNHMKQNLVVVIVTLQLITILFLGVFYYIKQSSVQTPSISWIDKNQLLPNPNSSLKNFYEPKPNITISNNLYFLGENYNFTTSYTYNNDSLNQEKNLLEKKPTNTFRIITLGDSFTFGANLNTKDNYPSQLETIINKELACPDKNFEVINLAVPGYDIQYSVERFRLRGVKYNPDLLLWLVIQDNLVRLNELMLPKSLKYEAEMKANKQIQTLAKEGNYYPDYKKARDEVITSLGEDTILNMQLDYLKELDNYYKGNMVLLTFPFTQSNYKQLLSNYSNSRPNTYYYDNLVNIYQQNRGVFPDFHPNEIGTNLIAQDIYTYLTKNNIISCN